MSFSDLKNSPFDVLIIGAGINGSATARQLCADGYNVLLVDRGDLGGASTARSGRVLHCGLQLLQPRRSVADYLRSPFDLAMRIGAARRAILDFEELCDDLPGRLQPMTILVPIFRESPFKGWHVDLGAKLIRRLGGRNADFQYRRWPAQDCASPFIADFGDRAAMESLVSFKDFRFDWPERIAIDAALDAEEGGATVLNFTEVRSARWASGGWRVQLAQRLSGNEEAEVSARVVLNLAGAWVDEVIGRTTPAMAGPRKVTPVKGVYILVRLPERYRGLGLAGTNSVGEPISCLPWSDLHYIGPTETAFSGGAADVKPEEEDIQFLIAEMRKLTPGLAITRGDVVMAWAGIRPITARKGYPKGKRLPFNVVHDLAGDGIPDMLTLSWGIVANHRSTARALSRAVSAKISPSGPASEIVSRNRTLPAAGRRLQDDFPVTISDVEFCVENEHAKDLTGILFSRTGLGWTGRMTAESVRLAAEAMAPLLLWNRDKIEHECDILKARLRAEHRFDLL